MLMSISRFLGMSVALLVVALVLQWLVRPAGAAERAAFPGEDSGLFMQVDAQVVGAMIVIDIGSRKAVCDALTPIEHALSELSLLSAPAE